jgi:hypothetical protein
MGQHGHVNQSGRRRRSRRLGSWRSLSRHLRQRDGGAVEQGQYGVVQFVGIEIIAWLDGSLFCLPKASPGLSNPQSKGRGRGERQRRGKHHANPGRTKQQRHPSRKAWGMGLRSEQIEMALDDADHVGSGTGRINGNETLGVSEASLNGSLMREFQIGISASVESSEEIQYRPRQRGFLNSDAMDAKFACRQISVEVVEEQLILQVSDDGI